MLRSDLGVYGRRDKKLSVSLLRFRLRRFTGQLAAGSWSQRRRQVRLTGS
jgi:hypothetical protein